MLVLLLLLLRSFLFSLLEEEYRLLFHLLLRRHQVLVQCVHVVDEAMSMLIYDDLLQLVLLLLSQLVLF